MLTRQAKNLDVEAKQLARQFRRVALHAPTLERQAKRLARQVEVPDAPVFDTRHRCGGAVGPWTLQLPVPAASAWRALRMKRDDSSLRADFSASDLPATFSSP